MVKGSDYMNLKRIRESKGITQRQLADASGVSLRMIQHYEQGFKDINMAAAVSVVRLADALGCDVHDILEPET